MSDNKQPDALDRLRRRPASSASPVTKDAPLLNDEARKLLEDKSKAAAQATKRAAEAGAKKSLDAGKAALGKFNSWRHERVEAKVKVGVPVEKWAPMEGLTPADVAEALAVREAALPVAEAPAMAVAPVGEEFIDTMAKEHLNGAANTLKALEEDEEEQGVLEAEREWKWSVGDVQEVMDKAGASDGESSGLLLMDGMGSLPATLSEDQIDIEVLAPGQAVSFADISGDEVEAAVGALTSEPENTAPVSVCLGKAGVGVTTVDTLAGSLSNQSNAINPGQKNRKEQLASNAFWIMIVGGLLAATFVALNREASAPDATPAPVATQVAARQPVTPPQVLEPVEIPASPEPAPVMAEPVPEVIERTLVAPTPAPEPEVPAVVPVKPAVVRKPVSVPAPTPTPKPVVIAKPPAVEKPKAAKPASAPVVSPESKQQIDSIRDFEKQVESMGG